MSLSWLPGQQIHLKGSESRLAFRLSRSPGLSFIAQHYCQVNALEVTYFPDCLPGIFNLSWAVCLGVADEDDS